MQFLAQNGTPTSNAPPEEGLTAEALLTVKEVAGILRVPDSWVYERTRRRGRGRMPHVKVGKYLRFRASEIRQYVEMLRRE